MDPRCQIFNTIKDHFSHSTWVRVEAAEDKRAATMEEQTLEGYEEDLLTTGLGFSPRGLGDNPRGGFSPRGLGSKPRDGWSPRGLGRSPRGLGGGSADPESVLAVFATDRRRLISAARSCRRSNRDKVDIFWQVLEK